MTLSDEADARIVSSTTVAGTGLAHPCRMSMPILLSAVLATALTAEMPVIVSDLETGPASHVKIENTATQPVTAWSIAVAKWGVLPTPPEPYLSCPGFLRPKSSNWLGVLNCDDGLTVSTIGEEATFDIAVKSF